MTAAALREVPGAVWLYHDPASSESIIMALKHLGAQKCLVRMYSGGASVPPPSRIPLAFEAHNPKLPESKHFDLSNRAPILFLHGFLGSKRENRHVSKYVFWPLCLGLF